MIHGEKLATPSTLYPYYDQMFSIDEVDKIIGISYKYVPESGATGEPNKPPIINYKRRSVVKWIPNNKDNSWIYNRFSDLILQTNSNYRFDIVGGEPIQYTEYSEEDNGEYNWHIDCSYNIDYKYMRKISLVTFLSDENEYEGGDFVLTTHVDDLFIPTQKKGHCVVFPSWLPHRVTPVVKGMRKSLVMWAYGPILR